MFGYHEVFHALTIVALSCQYVAIAFFVVRVDLTPLRRDRPRL